LARSDEESENRSVEDGAGRDDEILVDLRSLYEVLGIQDDPPGNVVWTRLPLIGAQSILRDQCFWAMKYSSIKTWNL
jgi:hypothetical protein